MNDLSTERLIERFLADPGDDVARHELRRRGGDDPEIAHLMQRQERLAAGLKGDRERLLQSGLSRDLRWEVEQLSRQTAVTPERLLNATSGRGSGLPYIMGLIVILISGVTIQVVRSSPETNGVRPVTMSAEQEVQSSGRIDLKIPQWAGGGSNSIEMSNPIVNDEREERSDRSAVSRPTGGLQDGRSENSIREQDASVPSDEKVQTDGDSQNQKVGRDVRSQQAKGSLTSPVRIEPK